MAKVKINFASLTDAQAAAPTTGSSKSKSTGFDFSSLADSDVATPVAEPSKKKVDTELSGQESSTVGVYKPLKVAVPKATEDDDSIWDNLAGFASTIKNSLSPAMRTLPVNLLSGGVTFATNLVTGVIKGAISEEDFKKDPYLRDIVDTIEKPSKDLMEAASNVNKAVQPQIELAKRQAGVKEEYMNMSISETMTQDLGQGARKLGVAALSQIPQVIGLAMTGGGNKARTFIAGATLGTSQAIQEEYEKDKDVSGVDIAQSAMKGVIEGLTEMIFDTDLKSAQNIGKAIIDVTMDGGKKAIKDMIEKVGKEEARDIIVRNYKDVVKNGLKGMGEEALEEVIATGASFVVDAIDSGKLNVKDYKKLGWDLLDASMLGASIGGPMSGLSAIYTKKNLTEEQKANVSRFQEVAKDKTLSPEIRQIAKNRADEIVNYDSDLIDKEYNRLSALPLNSRIEAFGILSKIDSAKEDALKIKDITLLADNRDIIEGYKKELESIFDANKPSAEEVEAEAPKQATSEDIKAEQDAYQEELAKAQASFNVTMGVPTEPMKFTAGFSVKTGGEDITPNNEFSPSPNYPLEVQKQEGGKRVQFTTKTSPDALLEADVYTVNQRGNKFATILSTKRNGVQEYYVPELENDKPFSNLDDAKFAVQEKLTGVLVSEKERSGIDRLRADKSMPKTDIVVKNDDGQDVILDPKAKKSIVNAVKAFKSVSSAPVYLYKNTEDFKKGVAKELGEDSDALEAAGKVGGGFFTNARDEDSIHINLANISETTIAHELFHGTVVNVARQNPSAFAAMRDAIINKLGDSDLINAYDEKGQLVKMSAKEYLDRYSKQYSPDQQAEEFLSELTGLLATDMAKLKDATIWETIKLAIRNLVKTAGIDIPIFDETANINDTVKFFNDLSKSLKTGKDINLGKLKITNEKTTEKGASVQTTNGESQTAEEDAGLRDSVSDAVKKKQARKGNELGKKKRKLSDVAAKAMAIEPTTPEDYALQYFINGGLVIRGSKNETQEKDTLFTLFSKSRMGGSKESSSEMSSRIRITGGRDSGALSISEIAEKTFAEYQQATKGDVGADVSTAFDYMDFRNAVESALMGYKSDVAMAKGLLDSKNKSTEEDAMALTEDEEFDKLRIQAEADAMGMTYEEFKAKLAELEGNPTIGAIEDAYAQALDMINDEDMAKLYELSDEDVAKIDELMADLDDNTGKLDDKLAEQKKVVRDLEAKRKKIVAAIEKAGKETQLDITGKAPIQEQLFGTDTKSLTDNLNAIDTQLAAAKADVAATQSAIDFQERGTVDMFKEEAPKKLGAEGDDLILQHGSPHNFEQFQLEKIGTGEGAQAFGYGLYFTDGSKIAKGYADKLSKDKTGTVYSVRIKNGRTSSWVDWRTPLDETQEQDLFNSLSKEDRTAYNKFVDDAFNNSTDKDYTGSVSDLKLGRDGFPYYDKQTAAGNLYLDLKDALGQQKATEVFKSAGFNGIKYEAKKGLSDSTNYVVFDPNSIEIIGKEQAPIAKTEQDFSSDKILNSFLNKLSEYGSLIRNPLMRGEYLFNDNVSLKFGRFNKEDRNEIELNSISVQNKGAGVGSKAMKSITDAADSLGTKLTLGAKVFGDDPKRLGTRFLVNFYKKSGFKVSEEYLSDMDFASEADAIEYVIANPSESLEMEREPLQAKLEEKPQPIAEKQTKPISAKAQSKIDAEIKSINEDIDFYTRKIENATEEIENTKSNYEKSITDIAIERSSLNASKLSKEKKSDELHSLAEKARDARDARDYYMKIYKSDISEGNRELKKLNARLAKLQQSEAGAKFQKQGMSVAPKSLGDINNKYPNVVLDVFESPSKKEISLDRIIVPKEDRNKGVGTDIVNEVTRYADSKGYRINLTPSSDFGGNKAKLTQFYKGFGFVENKGKNKDFSTRELMYRLPLEEVKAEEPNAVFTTLRTDKPIGFNYDTDLVARERFNIPSLKRIGEGSDRVVFDLGDNKVLKVAKTARGLAQNMYEGSYDLVEEGIIPEAFETGLNYIVTEKVETAKGSKAVNDLMRELKKFTQRDFDNRTSALQDVLVANDLDYVMNYDILYGDFSAARNWGVKNGKPIHLDGGTFGGVRMINQFSGVKNLEDDDFREVYYKSRQAKSEFKDKDKFTKFQKQGISVAPAYKYQMNEMFKDPQRLTKDIESKYDIRTTLRERGKAEGTLIEAERAITDQIVTSALSKVGVATFKTIGAIENAPLFKAGTGETVKLKQALTGWAGYTASGLRNVTLKAIQSNNKYAATAGRVAASLIGNLAKSDVLQEQRRLRSGSQLDANNSIAMLSKALNGMIGFDERALMRVHALLDPEAYEVLGGEDVPTSPSDLSLQELRLYNTLRDMNDFIHEWHFQNEFIDAPTYEKHKGKYFARMYEEIEKKEFADLNEAIDKMPAGADFRMFKERKDFDEIELTLMNDPIYITSKRLAMMLHNKATLEFCNAMANDPSYRIYKNKEDIPENNVKGFRLLDSSGGGKRYGELTNKYVPLALYEELRGTAFANKFVSTAYDGLRMYDGLAVRQFFKKTKTLYNPTTRLGNITTNFAFAWLAGVDPFTMIKNRVKAKDSLDKYDDYAKDLAMAGVLGTDVIVADLSRKKDSEGILGFLQKAGLREDIANKAKELDKYLMDSYGRTDDVAKISLYRSLVDDYGKSKEEAIRIVAESMQNYATVGKAYQFFSKMPLLGNPFVKFSSDMARIVANGFANRPLYMASFLGMMYGTARVLSALSGEPEDEREARESRAFIPKIPLGFTDIPLTWKVGKYEVNAARFISPYYVYDAGYRSNTVAELTKFAPIQLSYDNKVGFAADYAPVMSDPFIAPLVQTFVFDRDFRGLPIADPNGSKYTKQTVSGAEAAWNRFNYLGHSYASPAWGYVANLYSAATGQGDLYGRRRDIPSAILNSVIKVQEMETSDVKKAVINQVKYIDSEYKQIKTDITSRRNDDVEKIQEIIGSDATESQKEKQILNVKVNYSNYVEEMVDRMRELKVDREVPMDRLYKIEHPKKND